MKKLLWGFVLMIVVAVAAGGYYTQYASCLWGCMVKTNRFSEWNH